MSREEELDQEWRASVTRRLISIEASQKSTENYMAQIEASKIVPRIEKIEKQVTLLDRFRVRLITALVVVQSLLAAAWMVVSKIW